MKMRLDKSKIAVFKLGQEPKASVYWLSKTPQERFEALEFYRKQLYDETTPRLQRVLRVIKREKS